MDTKTYLRLPRKRNRPETRTGGRRPAAEIFYGGRVRKKRGRGKREERRDKGIWDEGVKDFTKIQII